MVSEWRNARLGDLLALQRGHDLTEENRSPGHVPVMGSAGHNGFHNKALAKGPGVVVGRSGASFGRVHFSATDYWPHNTVLYVTDFKGNDPLFCFFLLKTVDFSGFNSGSAQPSLNRNFLYGIPVRFPPLPEQHRIAHILGTLDDKIDLNRRMNATLEGISRAIFKSWFVDFDPVRQKAAGKQPVGMDAQTAALFPDSFEDSEIGKVPKGWGVVATRDFLSLAREAVDPAEHPTETFDHYSIPAFDSGRCPLPDVGADIKSQKLVVAPGSVLISKLNPRTPRVWIPTARHVRMPVASTEFLVAVPNDTTGVGVPFLFCFASSEAVSEYLASHASGTSNSHQRVRPEDFLSLRTVLATNAVLRAFDRIVGPHLQRANYVRSESRALAALRDTLLPKLLSGEVRVPEAEGTVQ